MRSRSHPETQGGHEYPRDQQWSSIMWDIIIGLIYHQYSRNYLAAARKQRAWA
jgi:hypothetical protein